MDMCTHSSSVYPGLGQKPGAPGPWPETPSELKQCSALTLGVFSLLAAAAGCRPVPWACAFFSYGAMVAQLWAPLARADCLGVGSAALGLHGRRWHKQVWAAVVLGCTLVPLWALALWLLPPAIGPRLAPLGRLRGGAAVNALWLMDQFFGVALPEEVFWRGYVQPVLQSVRRKNMGLMGLCCNEGTLLATALFALGHVVGGAGIWSLGTFFPGLLFALLRNRLDGLIAAILLHGLFNTAAALLATI